MYDIKNIKHNKNIEFIAPADLSLLKKAECFLDKQFPNFVRKLILDFGVLAINPDIEPDPFLILLGLGEGSDMFSDIVMFNLPSNPTIPEDLFVFAHEFDGQNDITYAVNSQGNVYSTILGYAPHYIKNKGSLRLNDWKLDYESFEEFWLKVVEKYLTM